MFIKTIYLKLLLFFYCYDVHLFNFIFPLNYYYYYFLNQSLFIKLNITDIPE